MVLDLSVGSQVVKIRSVLLSVQFVPKATDTTNGLSGP